MTLIKTARTFSLLAIVSSIQVSSLTFAYAHNPSAHIMPAKEWQITGQPSISADFIELEDVTVYRTDSHHQLLSFDLLDFSANDQTYILEKNAHIQAINQLAVIENLVSSNQLTAIQDPSNTTVITNDNETALNKADTESSVITDNSDTRSVLFFYLLGGLDLSEWFGFLLCFEYTPQKKPNFKSSLFSLWCVGFSCFACGL